MSESSPPDSASTNPVASAAPTAAKTITTIERIGTGLTVPAVLATVAVLGTVLYQDLTGSIQLESLDAVRTVLIGGVLLSIAAAVLGLIATALNLPGLRVPAMGRGFSTVFSGASLIAMGIFLFVVLLPRVNNVTNLNNTLAPFGTSILNNCQTPLDNETARYQQFSKDAHAVPTPSASNQLAFVQALSVFGLAMGNDISEFQKDSKTLSVALANLQALKAPSSKYNALVQGCITDVQGTIAFLNDASASKAVPTAQFVQELVQVVVPQIPTSIIPAADKPFVIATITAPGNFPSSYSAVGLLTAAAQFTTQNPAPTITIPRRYRIKANPGTTSGASDRGHHGW